MSIQLQAIKIDEAADELDDLLHEYAQLSKLTRLSEVQGKRMQEILDIACEDGLLSFWLSEVDHILGHDLGLLDDEHRKDYHNQRYVIKEYLLDIFEEDILNESPSTKIQSLIKSLERLGEAREEDEKNDMVNTKGIPYGIQYLSHFKRSRDEETTRKNGK